MTDAPLSFPAPGDWSFALEPPTGRRFEAIRLADAARRIIDRLARAEFDESELAEVAEQLEAAADVLEGHGGSRGYYGFAEAANAGDIHAFFDRSPIIGPANPLAAPLRIELDGETVVATATFGDAYEGPPGCVHGGVVAASFDEVLGMTQSMSGAPGMTGTLTVRYRSPTPLNTELRFEGRLMRTEGRKIFTEGTCHAGERLTAEAEAIFVSVDFSRFAGMLEQRHT